MSPKGLSPQALLILLFLTSCFPFSRSEGSSYREFLRRHLDHPKSDFQNDRTYCNLMMHRRHLNCQRGNTFIHSTEEQLTAICNSTGNALDGNQTSRTLFPITICNRARGHKRLYCRYRGRSAIRKIRVTCRRGFPVHYIAHV